MLVYYKYLFYTNYTRFIQLHVGVEAIRCTEILFQPSLVGCAEAGLAEIIEFVLKPFTADEQQQMVENVFMTGGCSQFPGTCRRCIDVDFDL